MSKNVFEYATRNKLRFPSSKGLIGIEDLWDLSLNDLDIVFKAINGTIKQAKEESLLDTKSIKDEELNIKLDIVKYIFNIKTEEINERIVEKERKEQKQKILEIMANRKENALLNKSDEELRKMLDELS